MNPFTIYVDVDETFVRSVSTKRIPMPAVIQHIRDLKEQGAVLYCWSSGGGEYARESAQEFGIADCFGGTIEPYQTELARHFRFVAAFAGLSREKALLQVVGDDGCDG